MTDEQKNVQNIVKTHFFEKIILDGLCSSTFLDMIDSSKLKEGITQLFDAFSEYNNKVHQQRFQIIGENEEEIQLKAGASKDDFPALRRHQIPLMPSNLHAILRDIVSVSDKAINGKY